MGSEQSQPNSTVASNGAIPRTTTAGSRSGPSSQAGPSAMSSAHRPFGSYNRPMSATTARLQRGNTIAVSGHTDGSFHSTVSVQTDSRPSSPPMSVCSDSDLPYISYTDKPIGDSPKLRNKGPANTSATAASAGYRNANARNSMFETSAATRRPQSGGAYSGSKPRPASTFVVVQEAPQKELDADLQRIQSIPQFLPVMRGSHNALPANRDPEVLERLQPSHLANMCNRMQSHIQLCAIKVTSEQTLINSRIAEVEVEAAQVLGTMTEKQKLYAMYADHFAKVRNISQQLSRCSTLLVQNIEAVEELNANLDLDHRLVPFDWKALFHQRAGVVGDDDDQDDEENATGIS